MKRILKTMAAFVVVFAFVFAACDNSSGNKAVNKTQLKAAISAAQGVHDAAKLYDDAAAGEKYWTADDKAAFQTRINAAKTVDEKDDATQDEVDAARTTLVADQTAFEAKGATKAGADEPASDALKASVQAVVDEANDIADTILLSNEIGSRLDNVQPYVEVADYTTFNTAIGALDTALKNAAITEGELNAALATFNAAKAAFDATIKAPVLLHYWKLDGNGNDESWHGTELNLDPGWAVFDGDEDDDWGRQVMSRPKADGNKPDGTTAIGLTHGVMNQFTASVWIKPENLAENVLQKILQIGEMDGFDLWGLSYIDGKIGLGNGNDEGFFVEDLDPDDYNDKWTHIALTFDAADDGQAILYIDGEKAGDEITGPKITLPDWSAAGGYSGTPTEIDFAAPNVNRISITDSETANQGFIGLVSDARFYSVVLTETEIATLAAALD